MSREVCTPLGLKLCPPVMYGFRMVLHCTVSHTGDGYTIGYTSTYPWPEGQTMQFHEYHHRRALHTGVINQAVWSAHSRRR